MEDAPEHVDPSIVAGLREHGLLRILHPEELVDYEAAVDLAEGLGLMLESGLLDDLENADPAGASISYSRLGFSAEELAGPILEELRKRGLVGGDLEGRAVQIDYRVREFVLALLAQILRTRGASHGLDLAPATDRPKAHKHLSALLDLPSMPSAGHVVSLDAAAVAVDLRAVGIDEILEFRAGHGEEYRAYARGLRGAVAELALVSDEEARDALLAERAAELGEAAARLADISSRRWKKPVNLMLGIGGAAWTIHSGDPLGAVIGAAPLMLDDSRSPDPPAGAFSYICRAANL